MLKPNALAGKKLGKYKVLKLIGRGGMAMVYLAMDDTLSRKVALKVLDASRSSDEHFVKRFQREARTAGRLNHPNIVTIYEVANIENIYYIAMEYLEGKPLDGILLDAQRSKKPPEISYTVKTVNQVASALMHAYKTEKIVHRDIKPANVIVDKDGQVTLTDFGIARALEEESDLTSDSGFIGTPMYMSPEHVEGGAIDHRSDIYSLGIMLYQMLVARVPFASATTTGAVMYKHVHEMPPSPRKFNKKINRKIERVVFKSIAKQPSKRFKTAEQMADALKEASKSGSGLLDIIPPISWSTIIAVLVVLLLIAGGWYAMSQGITLEDILPARQVEVEASPTVTPTLTETLTEVPTVIAVIEPTSENPLIVFTHQEIHLRIGPGETYDELGILGSDTELLVRARNNDDQWIKVETVDGSLGWIYASELDISGDELAELPKGVIPSSPTPTTDFTALALANMTATFTPTPTPTGTDTPLPTDTPTETPTPDPNSPTPTEVVATEPPPEPGVFISFEQNKTWQRGDEANGTFVHSSSTARNGSRSGKLDYQFGTTGSDYVVFLLKPATRLAGDPNQITAWIHGDGSKHYLNIWIKDAEGQSWQFTFGQINFVGWQQKTAYINPSQAWPVGHISGTDNGAVDYPIRFEAILLDDVPDEYTGNGTIYIDDLATAKGSGLPPTSTPIATPTRVPTSTSALSVGTPSSSGVSTPTPSGGVAPPAPAAGNFSGRIAFPVDNGSGRYDIWGIYLPDGEPFMAVAGARQPSMHKSTGSMLVNGEDNPNGYNHVLLIDRNFNYAGLVSGFPGDSHPYWDSNGTRFVFGNSTVQSGPAGSYFLYVQCSLAPPKEEGEESCSNILEKGILFGGGGNQVLGEYPVWSQDGNHNIYFRGAGGTSPSGLYLIPSWSNVRDGGGQLPARILNAPNARPSDAFGNRIFFFSNDLEGNWEAYSIRTDGGGLINLSNSPGSDGQPTVSPDGGWVAFSSDREGKWAVYVVPSSGGTAQKLFDYPKPVPWGVGNHDWTTERIAWGP